MKAFGFIENKEICCESCKANSIQDDSIESDFFEIPTDELADSIYFNGKFECACCGYDFDQSGSFQDAIDLETIEAENTKRDLNNWLHYQRV